MAHPFSRRFWLIPALLALRTSPVSGQATPASAERKPGEARPLRVDGRVVGDASGGFRVVPDGGGEPVELVPGVELAFPAKAPDPAAAVVPFRAILGHDLQVSGRLGAIEAGAVLLEDGPSGRPVRIRRDGVLALVQRAGEAQVLADGFEAIDPKLWVGLGAPETVEQPKFSGGRSLRLPAGGASLSHTLAEPVDAGRLDLAFHDDGAVADGLRWFVDLTFRGPTGPETIRAILGWSDDSLAVESSPGGPALAVQRLARRPGWRRLGVRFGPDRLVVAVDSDELARGKGAGGPLVELRLATTAMRAAPPGLAGHLDDLRLARAVGVVEGQDVDPRQDEARLVGGDQLFGAIASADAKGVTIAVDGHPTPLPWSAVRGLHFRRVAAPAAPVEGLLVRLEWHASPGDDPNDFDRAEGALVAADDAALTLDVPYCGPVAVARERVRRISVRGRGTRVVVDPYAHHLGDAISTGKDAVLLDPPQPEGGTLERTFTLAAVPPGRAAVVLDVVDVVGVSGNLLHSVKVQDGSLRTGLALNGTAIGDLNSQIRSMNEAPERIRVEIPAGLLKAGENRLRFVQAGEKGNPTELDDLGLLGIAVEILAASPEAPRP